MTKRVQLKALYFLLSIVMAITFSCSEVDFELPAGPMGPEGKSAYEFWKEKVEKGEVENWPKDKTSEADFLVYIKGEKGDKGEDGKSAYEMWKEMISSGNIFNPHNPNENWSKDRNTEADFWNFLTGRDGLSPHIGDNGNWWIGDKDTGVAAKGKDGQDGKDGITPHIGTNGNWWIGITDTGVPAKGQDGDDGITPHIGTNGNWWIGNRDTDVPAKGKDGIDGNNIKWYSKSVGEDKDHQFNAYPIGTNEQKPNAITANVWNYDPAWKVYWYENGVKMGEMKQFTGYDTSIVNYVNKHQSGFKHKGIGAAPAEHMFYAVPQSAESIIKIEVVDRFGNMYSQIIEQTER